MRKWENPIADPRSFHRLIERLNVRLTQLRVSRGKSKHAQPEKFSLRKSRKFSFIDSKTLIFPFMLIQRGGGKKKKTKRVFGPTSHPAVLVGFIGLEAVKEKRRRERSNRFMCSSAGLSRASRHNAVKKLRCCYISSNGVSLKVGRGKCDGGWGREGERGQHWNVVCAQVRRRRGSEMIR